MIRHAPVDGPRPIHAHEFDATLALCNEVLRADGPPTIAEEYPLVLTPDNAAHMHVIVSGRRIVSHAACYAATMRVDEFTTLRIGGVNSVATDPAFRKRGYASELVQACCEDLRRQGCHLAVLWTEVKGFYEQLGFHSLGSQLLYRVAWSDAKRFDTDARIGDAGPGDVAAMAELRAARLPHIVRTEAEWAKYMRIPRMHAWVARRDGRCVAYAIVGKGEDFQGCCHEWGGGARDVLALLAHAAHQMPRRELIVLGPDERDGVSRSLQQTGAAHIRTPLGMFRCLDPQGTFAAIERRLTATVKSDWEFQRTDDGWQLRIDGVPTPPMSAETWCALLLGPTRPSELLAVPKKIGLLLDKAFPLPVFIWGLDSV